VGRRSRVRFPARVRGFSPLENGETSSGAHSASYTEGTGVFYSEVKRPGREADYSPPSNAEFSVPAWTGIAYRRVNVLLCCLGLLSHCGGSVLLWHMAVRRSYPNVGAE